MPLAHLFGASGYTRGDIRDYKPLFEKLSTQSSKLKATSDSKEVKTLIDDIEQLETALKESEQIKITDLVREHAEKALAVEINEGKDSHPNLQKAYKVSKYLYQIPRVGGYIKDPKTKEELQKTRDTKDRLFRKRTAHEILEQGIYPTCSDFGIVFKSLMIALEVPSVYVEMFHEDYLLDKKFHGHVVVKIQAGEKWYYIDPQNNQKRVSETLEELFPLVFYKEGLDSWDIGIRSYSDMHKARQESLEELMERYKDMLKKIYEKKLELTEKILHSQNVQ